MTRFAGQIDLTDFLGEGDDWSKVGDATTAARSSGAIANIEGQSAVTNQGIASVAADQASKYKAKAIEKGAAAEASAAVHGAIWDGFSTIGGAGISAYGKANNLGTYGD